MSNVTNSNSLNSTASNLLEMAALHASILVTTLGQNGNNGVVTGQSNNDATLTNPIITTRPWVDPPEEYTPFDQQEAIDLLPVGNAGNPATIIFFDVPVGLDGVIKAYSWNFEGGGFDQGSGDLVVQILRNQAAVRNFENIKVEKGSIQFPRPISPIRVYSGQRVSMTINHVNNPALNGKVVGAFQGYFYPSKS